MESWSTTTLLTEQKGQEPARAPVDNSGIKPLRPNKRAQFRLLFTGAVRAILIDLARHPGGVAVLRNAIEAERAERDQDADCARIEAVIGLAKQGMTTLEHRQLDADAMHEKWSALRDQTIFVIRDVRHHVIRRANAAKETERSMIEQLLLEESDPRVTRGFSAELEKVPTQWLLHYLNYLIQHDDLPRIQGVRMLFNARGDRRPYEASFDRMLAQFARARCGELGERLARICRAAERTDAMIADLLVPVRPRPQVEASADAPPPSLRTLPQAT